VKLLLDTHVRLDLVLDRNPHAEAASVLFDQVQRGALKAAVAGHSVANVHYLASPLRGRRQARRFLLD